MNFLELSIKKLKEENKKLYKEVINGYNYDCVIFIARGSYYIGKDLSEFNEVPLLEIFAKRKGSKIKKILSPLLNMIPKRMKIFLREKEVKSDYHEKNSDRNVYFDRVIWNKYRDKKNILVVDDSVDTGYSVKSVLEVVQKFFENANVKVAALNCFNKSKQIVKTDFYLYKDTMLKGPWSNDSKENKMYIKEYEEWHNNQK